MFARVLGRFCHRRRHDGGPRIGYANTAIGLRGQRRVAVGDGRLSASGRPRHRRASPVLARCSGNHRVRGGLGLALRALFLMAFPHAFMAAADASLRVGALWVSVDVFIGLVGLYLTYVGWGPTPSQPVAQAETSTPELPRAA